MASTQRVAKLTNQVTRRACLKLMLAATGAQHLMGSRETANSGPDRRRNFQRFYQATAVITFCGITIFSRKGVGGGYAVAEDVPQGSDTAIALQFAGGSWPAKAHGVNRLGYIRESIVEHSGDLAHAEYFGFMTSSAEKNFDQAKKSFADKSGKPVPYSATEGIAHAGVWNFSLSRLMLSSSLTFSDSGKLISEVRTAMASDRERVQTENRFGALQTPNTFLNSLRQALLNRSPITEHSLVYNGKAFHMQCAKQAEGNLMRLNGTLEETVTGHNTPFKLWYEKDSANFLPVKIEYKAKSFLKLVFEMEPNWDGPAPAQLLHKEIA